MWIDFSSLQYGHRLGNEKNNRWCPKRNKMEHYITIRGSWLCWRSCFIITYPSPFAREDRNNFASQVGLKINQTKTEIITLNFTNPAAIQVDGKDLPITEIFTYLGSTVRNDGGAGNDIMDRLNKGRNIFRTLNNVWKSSQYSKPTKIKLRTINSVIWIRMLKDDRKRLKQTVSFFIPKALEESCAVSGPTRFLTKTYSDNVINKVLLWF